MRKTTQLFNSLVLTVALGASLAACSTPEENSSAACDSYAKLVGSVAEVKTSLTSASSVGEIQAARDKVKTSYAELQEALEEVSSDRKEALDAAVKDFGKAVADVDKNLTVPQAREALADDVAKVEAAQTEFSKDLTC